VAKLDFCVTIADPRTADTELIAVSEGFERLTGYSAEEILGGSCRFLNEGSAGSLWLEMGMRVANKTGAQFSAVMVNRKKSGEFFKVFFNVRGLVIAQNVNTGEDFWLLVSIQVDVSDLDEVPEDHLAEVAKCIRRKLAKEFLVLGTSALLRSSAAKLSTPEGEESKSSDDANDANEWRLVPHAVWKEGLVYPSSKEGQAQGIFDVAWEIGSPRSLEALSDETIETATMCERASSKFKAVSLQTSNRQALIAQVAFVTVAACSFAMWQAFRRRGG